MLTKFIYESIEDVLKPKHHNDIRKDLDVLFKKMPKPNVKFFKALKTDLKNDAGTFYRCALVLTRDYEWKVWFYRYFHGTKRWGIDEIYDLNTVKTKKQDLTFHRFDPKYPLNKIHNLDELVKEADELIKKYKEKIMLKENKDLSDIFKPKNEKEIYDVFKQHGITPDIISIRIRKPNTEYINKRLERAVAIFNVNVEEYKGPVPSEENEYNFLGVYGKPWNVLLFHIHYFQIPYQPMFLNIEMLKHRIYENINHKGSQLFESSLNDIKETDVLSKQYMDRNIKGDNYIVELFMWSYADEHGLDLEEMDVDEWLSTKEADEWIDYEMETRVYDAIDLFKLDIIDDNGDIRIWRKMTVADNWLEHLEKQGKRLGIYWSWEEDAADTHWGYDNTKNVVTLESIVKENHVDWIETLRANAHPSSEEEKEVTLFKNTLLKIKRIWIKDEEIDISTIKEKIFRA